MVDFEKLLSPEAKERLEHERRRVKEFANYDLKELITMTKHYLTNCSLKQSDHYDGVLQNIVVPELLKRLELLTWHAPTEHADKQP